MRGKNRNHLTKLLSCGISSVKGERAVEAWLQTTALLPPTRILAAGKAAAAMFAGLPKEWQAFTPTLLVTKDGHLAGNSIGRNVTAIEASHPVPNEMSLKAGEMAFEFVTSCKSHDRLLMLVSGGASSLVEHLSTGVDLDELRNLTNAALAGGSSIAELNSRRKRISEIKGGKLLSHFAGASVDILAISDVCGDKIDIIGSGIGAKPKKTPFAYRSHVVASNEVARKAVIKSARSLGYRIISNAETMYDDVNCIADRIASDVTLGPCGLYVYGGEPTVVLPDNPGKGGRNQALALALAKRLRDRTDISGVVAGTDGTDGPTNAAGAFLDGYSFESEPGGDEALRRANSAQFFALTGDQIVTGPTGTNVMDLAILLKQA